MGNLNYNAKCQNGRPSVDGYGAPALTGNVLVPGTTGVRILGGVITGAAGSIEKMAGDLELDFAGWWNTNIEPLRDGQCWGYDLRPVRGESDMSNHGGGWAVDLNSVLHPLGTLTLSATQKSKISAILSSRYKGALRSGAFYDGRKDEMHEETTGTDAQIRAAWEAIFGAGPEQPQPPAVPTKPTSGVQPAQPFPLPAGYYYGPLDGPAQSISGQYKTDTETVRRGLKLWQQRMRDRGWVLDADGYYGPQTAAVARAFQTEKGLEVDGLIGPATWNAAWTAPIT